MNYLITYLIIVQTRDLYIECTQRFTKFNKIRFSFLNLLNNCILSNVLTYITKVKKKHLLTNKVFVTYKPYFYFCIFEL